MPFLIMVIFISRIIREANPSECCASSARRASRSAEGLDRDQTLQRVEYLGAHREKRAPARAPRGGERLR